jgi:Cu/Ag efflux protein CusF
MKRKSSMLTPALILALAAVLPAAAWAGTTKTHDTTAEVVSVDVKAKTITLKDEKGESHTAPLMGKAVDEAKHLKAGDKVTATCQDNEKGEHEGVTALKKV